VTITEVQKFISYYNLTLLFYFNLINLEVGICMVFVDNIRVLAYFSGLVQSGSGRGWERILEKALLNTK
jgi:hypothetical protein